MLPFFLLAAATPCSTSLQDSTPSARAEPEALVEAVDTARLRSFHEALAGQPHDAGTPGDVAVVEWLAETFASFFSGPQVSVGFVSNL